MKYIKKMYEVVEDDYMLYKVFHSSEYYSTFKNILFIGSEDECISYIAENTKPNTPILLEYLPYMMKSEYDRLNHNENFNIRRDRVNFEKPYDDIEIIKVGDYNVYCLFGDVLYYPNREAILAMKGKSDTLTLNNQSYNQFLNEFKKRFYSISELALSDLVVSVETTANINWDAMKKLEKAYVKDGLKKNDPMFKMRSLKPADRIKTNDVFSLNFNLNGDESICVLDDFITSGSTFRNAFSKIPDNINKVGVCLFKLL